MPRPDVSEERRPQILAAATQVFVRSGYRKTSMPQIARQAGLSVGGVYWYFKSKEEIVRAILGQLFQQDLESLEILLNSDAPARQRVERFAARYAEIYSEYAWLNPAGLQFYAEATHDAQVRGFILEYLGQYRSALVRLLEQGMRRGEFRPSAPQDVANVILGLEEGLSLLCTIDPQGVRWHSSFQSGIELILTGLSVQAGPAAPANQK